MNVNKVISPKMVTYAIVLVAALLIVFKFYSYMAHPWTRDGLVRANIIEVTPRVTGPVSAIYVSDNSHVNAGDLLFTIDDRTYITAVNQAEASLAQANAVLQRAKNELNKNQAVNKKSPGSIPVLTLNNLMSDVQSSDANVQAAQALLENARLNLEFTKVYASKSGFITNMHLVEGAQVVANQPVVALIDETSYWIEGFFKETDIGNMAIGNKAMITLMTYPDHPFTGEIESIGYGIAQSDGSTSSQLLPSINPNFEWIRLAQRLPVKIKVTELPKGVELRVGTTASVMIQTE